mmetsp:Transcript_31916/g.56286  ORF Transcript_31916/g.56286 Transcript_31916/m.56286 type:complete len:226 (-) Transcript_31916:1464-2141(-)
MVTLGKSSESGLDQQMVRNTMASAVPVAFLFHCHGQQPWHPWRPSCRPWRHGASMHQEACPSWERFLLVEVAELREHAPREAVANCSQAAVAELRHRQRAGSPLAKAALDAACHLGREQWPSCSVRLFALLLRLLLRLKLTPEHLQPPPRLQRVGWRLPRPPPLGLSALQSRPLEPLAELALPNPETTALNQRKQCQQRQVARRLTLETAPPRCWRRPSSWLHFR